MVIILGAALVAAGGLAVWLLIRYQQLRTRYAGIVSIDDAIAKAAAELERLRATAVAESSRAQAEYDVLRGAYATANATYQRLKHELSLVEENVEDISFGVYKPHFNFASSDDYKSKLTAVNDRQKSMIRADGAVRCGAAWTINNSRREGERMQKQYSKLLLRAFNAECDAAIARVAWNNVSRMEERVAQAFKTINSLGGVMQIEITDPYRGLKLDELRLEFELENKKHEELEEQREIRDQQREEEKAQKEFARAEKEAADDEVRYQRALEKARAETAKARGEELAALNEKVKKIEASLAEARLQKERAISRAQQTRSGYVYVISNIGSFGETMFKIGMTRRLDPMERVHELSDASVPFTFDVHAMFFTEDAPTLENALHRHFASKRVNLVNGRKEFFEVSLLELEMFAKEKNHKIEFTKLAEAREYRQSIALRNKAAEMEARSNAVPPPIPAAAQFPTGI